MKKLLAFAILAALVCAGALMADTSPWSEPFDFWGGKIKDNIVLKPTDKLAYSSAMAEGEPKSLTITVKDTSDSKITASIFEDDSATPVEGTVVWKYTDKKYKDFPIDDTYRLTETVVSDKETKVFTKDVTILPEPAGLLLLGLAAVFFLRKRVKSLLAIAALILVSALSAQAECTVTEVKGMQMWPFDTSVIINYTLECDTDSLLQVKFYGSVYDDGSWPFNLFSAGSLSGDGVGTLPGPGKYKVIWRPDDVFTHSVNHLMVRIEAVEISKRLYMVIDLESGAISYLKDVPEGGWTDEYKTTKMVLRRVKAGTFTMGSPQYESDWRKDYEIQHEVTLTKDFYIGVFETTQKQYKMITGSDPSGSKGDMRPVETVTFSMIRGKEKGAGWPANNDVDEDSFFGKFRAKTGKAFDLPTEAQWEYACRAGTCKAWNNNTDASKEGYQDDNLDKLGRYSENGKDGKGGYNDLHTTVGSYLPNYWGLYDMHGNVWEMCLDWWGDPGSYTSDPVTDPVGAAEGTSRHMRGGSQANIAGECRSACRAGNGPNDRYEFVGFRVAMTVSDDDDDDPDDGPAFAEKYMVVDLASGESSYLDDRPDGGWADEYKTTKMVLRKVEAGKFTMGSPEDELGREADEYQHEVTLTKDFYIGVFQTTQKQYETIAGAGSNFSHYSGDTRPVEYVSYNLIRGTDKGDDWPSNNYVDEDSFLGKLRAKTGANFDLPTEAQWEFACRSGTTTALNNGSNITNFYQDGNMNELGRYWYNGGEDDGTAVVGSYLPNAWGLYDMHGNVWEWCLDWWDDSESWSTDPVTDPVGAIVGSRRLLRGGTHINGAGRCRSAHRSISYPAVNNINYGFRVVLVP